MEADSQGKTMRAMQQMLGRSQSQDDERCHKWSRGQPGLWLADALQAEPLIGQYQGLMGDKMLQMIGDLGGWWWGLPAWLRSYKYISFLQRWATNSQPQPSSSQAVSESCTLIKRIEDTDIREAHILPESGGQWRDKEWGHYPLLCHFIVSWCLRIIIEWSSQSSSS